MQSEQLQKLRDEIMTLKVENKELEDKIAQLRAEQPVSPTSVMSSDSELPDLEPDESVSSDSSDSSDSTDSTDSEQLPELVSLEKPDPEKLNDYIIMMNSANSDERFEGLRFIRRLTSQEGVSGDLLTKIVGGGVLDRIGDIFLPRIDSEEEDDRIISECLWILTNFAAGEYAQNIVDLGILDEIVHYTTINTEEINLNAVWCLGNLLGDSKTNEIAKKTWKAIDYLVSNVLGSNDNKIRENSMWALSNTFRFKNNSVEEVQKVLPILNQILYENIENTMTTDSLWTLSYLLDCDNSEITESVYSGINWRLVVDMIDSTNKKVAIRVIGDFIAEFSAPRISELVERGLFTQLTKLDISTMTITKVREMMWILSNIACEPEFVNKLLEQTDLLDAVIEKLMCIPDNNKCVGELVHFVSNALTSLQINHDDNGLANVIDYLKSKGIVECLNNYIPQNLEGVLVDNCLYWLCDDK
jgi:hypothetical protein